MSHGSYDSNLGSEILILGGDIRSRSWPNIGDSYGIIPIGKITLSAKRIIDEITDNHPIDICSVC